MNINLFSEESLRVSTQNSNLFNDIKCGDREECLTLETYTFFIVQIRKKAHIVKIFSFCDINSLAAYDFGYWADSELIWQSIDETQKPVSEEGDYKKALEQAISVIKSWHQADDVWDIYYNHAPEMKLIREALPKPPITNK